jgi:hypothetical protein
MAFTWKAALHLSTAGFPPHSTCHVFGVTAFYCHVPNPAGMTEDRHGKPYLWLPFGIICESWVFVSVHQEGMHAGCNKAFIATTLVHCRMCPT